MKYNIVKLIKDLNTRRMAGENVNLRSALSSEYNRTPEKVYHDLGIDPYTTSVDQLMSMGEDQRWLVPEIFRDAIMMHMNEDLFIEDIVAETVTEDTGSYAMPYVDIREIYKRTKGKTSTPGTDPDRVRLKSGVKYVRTKGHKIAIDVPYSVIRRSKLAHINTFVRGVGHYFTLEILRRALDVLINGDNARDENDNVVDSAANVIGVDSVTNGITQTDYKRGAMRLSKLGKQPTAMLGDEAMLIKVSDFPVFNKTMNGDPATALNIKTQLPSNLDGFVTDYTGAKRLVLLSKLFALVKILSQAFMVETDKIIAQQTEEAVASIEFGFGVLHADGRVVIDEEKEFATNGFADWMDLLPNQE